MDRKKKNIIELTRMTASQALHEEKLPIALALDNVRSLNNVGAMLRTADAFALESVTMCGITGTPPSPEIAKTALGAEESVKWSHVPDTLEFIRERQRNGWKICCLEQTHNSLSLDEFKPSTDEKYLLVVGNEVQGVQQEIVDAADIILEIPQRGAKHSLNVSVSAGIALWHIFAPFHTKE